MLKEAAGSKGITNQVPVNLRPSYAGSALFSLQDCGNSRVLLNVAFNSGIMTGGQIIEMTKRECRMTKAARNPNDEVIEPACCFEASCFVLNSSFVIRHSSFSSS